MAAGSIRTLRACLAEFLLRRQPPMRVIVVKRGSHDFGWLVVVDRCIRTATLRSWKAGAFVRLDLGFRPNPAKQALTRVLGRWVHPSVPQTRSRTILVTAQVLCE